VPTALAGEYYYIPQLSPLPPRLHESHWIADRAIDFLQQRDDSRPFFLWSSFSKPHPPFENPHPWPWLYRGPEMARPFRHERYEQALCFWNRIQNRYKFRDDGVDDHLLRTMRAAYYASISFVDYNVGRILDALGDEIDRTLVIFTSDHGEMLGDFGSFGKRCMLEPSAHVPLIVRWPGQLPSGARCRAPVSNLDLLPTLLDAAGEKAKGDVDPDGASLLNVVAGRAGRRYVYSQQSQRDYGLYLITDGRWKYSYSAADEKAWLYDLATDPHETRNLAYNSIYARERDRLRSALLARFEADGYESAVEGGDWRSYGVATLNDDPDYGLLLPHTEAMRERIAELGEGYARDVSVPQAEAFKLLEMLVFDG
jgi:arylsulfatase A-like enzyme